MGTKVNKKGIQTLDSTDCMIVNELLKDAKIPLRALANTLGVSSVTIMNRVKRLEKCGVIHHYEPRINYDSLGYDIHVLIDIRIAKGKLIDLEKKIARAPQVYAVYDTTGDFDAALLARFKSTRSMDTFLKQIQSYDFVVRTNTRLILNTIKDKQIEL